MATAIEEEGLTLSYDLKEMEALAERASNLKLHYGLCPDESIPPEARDPTVWSDKEVKLVLPADLIDLSCR